MIPISLEFGFTFSLFFLPTNLCESLTQHHQSFIHIFVFLFHCLFPFDAFLFWCRFIIIFFPSLLFNYFFVWFLFFFLLLPNTHKLYHFQAYKRDTFCVFVACHVLWREKCAFYVFTLVYVLCWEDSVWLFMGLFLFPNILFNFFPNEKITHKDAIWYCIYCSQFMHMDFYSVIKPISE